MKILGGAERLASHTTASVIWEPVRHMIYDILLIDSWSIPQLNELRYNGLDRS